MFTNFHGFICKCVRIYNEFGMIYIRNIPERQGIYIPVSYKDPAGSELYHFLLYNTINLTKSVDEILRTADFNNDFNADFAVYPEPILSAGGLFYFFTFELPDDMVEGTYEYILMHGDSILSRGVAMVGEFQNQDSQYHKDIEYEQYTGE